MMPYHQPVLCDVVLELFRGRGRGSDAGKAGRGSKGGKAVDCTVGAGGHSEILLREATEVLAVDRDPEALAEAKKRLGATSVEYLQGGFGEAPVLNRIVSFEPDFVLLDLGLSSHQIDAADRGFSFRPGIPLDMRMSPAGGTAGDFLNEAPKQEIRRIFAEYADERKAGKLAAAIVRRRRKRHFMVSDDLVNAVREVLGPSSGPADFARLFQAVRMEVNRELSQLETALPRLLEALNAGGRIVAIAYHSGEDRIVKQTFNSWARSCVCPPELPVCRCRGRPLGTVLTRKPVRPSEQEIESNVRARSARLRSFEKSGGA